MTQTTKLLEYLKEHGVITEKQALSYLKIKRLSARIHDLRELGYEIETVYKTGENEYGKHRYVDKYRLKGEYK